MNNAVKAILSVVAAALGAYCREISIPVIVLTAVMAVDYLSGVAAAYVAKELSSRVGVIGIVKKVGYFCVVIVGMAVDYLAAVLGEQVGVELQGQFFGLLVCAWLIINELLSILENAGRMGLPVPEFLREALEKLQEPKTH